MTLIWTRVDQKLMHGQISVAWVPHLAIDAIVVADNDSVEDLWAQKVMRMGLPPEVALIRFTTPDQLVQVLDDEELLGRRVMVIFRSLEGVLEAVCSGLDLARLNLGNQARQGPDQNIRLAESFYVRCRDLDGLARLQRQGLEVLLQAVPSGKAVRWTAGEGPGA